MRKRPSAWTPPGPLTVPPVGDPSLQPGPGETLDCLSGHWRIFQLKQGHRFSTDDLLTAWAAVCSFLDPERPPRSYLDLGCGVGSVGLMVLWHFPDLKAVGVEAQAVSCELARRSARYNGVADRFEVRRGDFRAPGILAKEETFDLVTGSPPYLRLGEGTRSRLAQRGPCRFEDRGGAGDYLQALSAHLADGGFAVWIHATRYLEENLRAAEQAGLSSIRWRRVVFREGRDSLVTLFRGQAAGSAAVSPREEPPLTVRARDGRWSPEQRAVRLSMGFPA